MSIISKLIRSTGRIIEIIRNALLINYLRLKYPSIEIKGKTIVEKGCKIICVDGGKLLLDSAYISTGSFLIAYKGANLEIKKSFVGRACVIAAQNSIKIMEDCELAEMVVVRDQNHKHNLTSTKVPEQGFNTGEIIIKSNVWVGAKATILRGVVIGSNSVVGAHSLVNKSVPESTVSVGIPARKVK